MESCDAPPLRRLTSLAGRQIFIQVINITTGILLTRLLPKTEFAWLTIGASMMTAFLVFIEGGCGLGIQSLGGSIWQDRGAFRTLVATALSLRWRLGSLFGLCSLPLPLWMLLRNEAPAGYALLILAAVGLGFPAVMSIGILSSALKLQGRHREALHTDLCGSLCRAGLIGMAALVWLNAAVAALAASVSLMLQLRLLQQACAEWKAEETGTSPEIQRGLFQQIGALLPNAVYQVLQGQICIWLLSLTASVSVVADYGVLNRLGSLFAIVSSLAYQLVIPGLARTQSAGHLGWRLAQFMVAYAGFTLAATLGGWYGADVILWVFGPSYSHLSGAVSWMMLLQGLYALSVILWWFNTSRGWVRLSWLNPVLTILVQVVVFTVYRPSTLLALLSCLFLTLMPSLLIALFEVCRGIRRLQKTAADKRSE